MLCVDVSIFLLSLQSIENDRRLVDGIVVTVVNTETEVLLMRFTFAIHDFMQCIGIFLHFNEGDIRNRTQM